MPNGIGSGFIAEKNTTHKNERIQMREFRDRNKQTEM